VKRRLLQILCGISACVAVATAAIWVHSRFAHGALAFAKVDRIGEHRSFARMRNLEWYSGKVCIYWVDATILDPSAFEVYAGKEDRGWFAHFSAGPHDDPDVDAYFKLFGHSFLGGQFYHAFRHHPEWNGPQWVIWLPCWWILLVTVPLPALLLFRRLRTKRRIRSGQCAACGYDLRATPDRCPECGAVPALSRPRQVEAPTSPNSVKE